MPPDIRPMGAGVTSSVYAPLADPHRLARIANHDLFNPELQERLDAACAESVRRLGWPVALVTIVLDNAQFIGGCHGLTADATPTSAVLGRVAPIEWSFCAYAVMGERPYLVSDARRHPNHRGTYAVTDLGVTSYAGVPLRTSDGYLLGAHCVLDRAPRELGDAGLAALSETAAAVERILGTYRTIPDLG